MLVFFEMTPQQPNQPHPNDNLIPVARLAGPSPIIKVPRLPGVEQPDVVRVERRPQEGYPPQPGNNQGMYGKIAKSAALIGGGIAVGALAHHYFGHNNENTNVADNTPAPNQQQMTTTKVSASIPEPSKPVVQQQTYSQPVMKSAAAPSTVKAFYTIKPQPMLNPGRPPSIMIGNGSPY